MVKEEMMDNLVGNIVALVRLHSFVGDKFFAEKLERKISVMLSTMLNVLKEERSGDVAQYRVDCERALAAIESVLEFFKELVYLNFIKSGPLLLSVEQNLLRLKLEVVTRRKAFNAITREAITDKAALVESELKKSEIVSATAKADKSKLAGSKKQILDFIKKYPEIRTKDIIYEFNALSGRTIKRNLTDLLRSGFVRKRIDNKAVYYSIAK